MTDTALTMTAGVPYAQRIRVVDGKNLWSTLAAFEVRSQVRSGVGTNYTLRADLGQFMTTGYDGNDIVIDLALTGEDTRVNVASGYYDVFLSDIGVTDARAVRILAGRLTVTPVVTAAADA